jgi:DNA-binding NarL/FixJ family response regulator
LAARALETLPDTHALRSRAAAIDGHSNFQLSRFDEAEQAFLEAKRTAFDEQDETEALHGLALARIFGERGDADSVVSELWRRRHTSPAHLLRAAAAELSHRRLNGGLAQPLSLDEPLHACSQVGDPRARTSFFYAASYALAQRGEYRSAELWLNRFLADIREYDLEFAKPHAAWTGALIRLGLRQFGEAERLLQSLEDAAAARSDAGHALNARILRARLLLQTGKHEDAVALTSSEPPTEVYPSWRGEYSATRAMALAATGEATRAADEARIALTTSRMAEVRMLAAAAIAISAADAGDFDAAAKLLVEGATLGVWDPVVCALRTSATLSQGLAREKQWRTLLESLYEASNDLGLARRAGFRTRSTRSPAQLLTPRELEVLGLIARGMRNAEIAKALFIAPSTAKTHVCHVLAKLGVRTRAQAAGRLEMFS